MNQKLTEEIAYHILANLGVLPSDFVDQDVSKSILDQQFLLPEKLTFETEDGQILHKNIYGCQITVASKELKLLLADCSQSKDVPEFCLYTQLKDSPAFALFLVFNRLVSEPPPADAMIAVNTDGKYWMPCTVYLQGTYLAGMEQLRDLGFGWGKCSSYHDQYLQLLSFIKFHDNFYEVLDEGKED